jgi:hypothetical protein
VFSRGAIGSTFGVPCSIWRPGPRLTSPGAGAGERDGTRSGPGGFGVIVAMLPLPSLLLWASSIAEGGLISVARGLHR